jgi:uncharacterized membrane protein YbhN (UPF0104 family)
VASDRAFVDHAGQAQIESKRGRWAWVLRVAAAVAIISVLVGSIGIHDVLRDIKACPPGIAFSAFMLTLVAHGFAAYQLRQLAKSQQYDLPRSDAMLLQLSSVYYGLFIPGGSGTAWAVRLIRLTRGSGRFMSAVKLVAGDRALATATNAAIGVAASLFITGHAAAWIGSLLLAVTVAATLLLLTVFVSIDDSHLAWLRRFPVLSRAVSKSGGRSTTLRRPDATTIGLVTCASLASHVAGLLAWLLLAQAMGVGLEPVEIAWVRSAAMVAMMLPATVGGLGVREGTVVSLMGVVGTAASDALALSLVVFATTTLAVGVVGGVLEAHYLSRNTRPTRRAHAAPTLTP